MTKREFKAESKRLMDLMVNSIYTNKDIFLRELLSNASDALDKRYYKVLEDDSIPFDREDYYITVNANKDARTLTISDTGVGMDAEELEENLGTIAKSGTYEFKNLMKEREPSAQVIGQFGVGFYSAFMVAEEVEVISHSMESGVAWHWISRGSEGYEIKEGQHPEIGTTIILHLKEDDEEESYSRYLESGVLEDLIVKYSNYLRHPIYLGAAEDRRQVNSMVPIWKKNKNELSDEDYEQFYLDQHYGFDKPLDYLHIQAEGAVSYRGILFLPSKTPFDYYSKEYKKGLQLYSNGVLIMDRCETLLPDYFSFVKGVIDSEDVNLNISREVLQHDRQLRIIAGNVEKKIVSFLKKLMEQNREKYETFFKEFGPSIKMGIYESFGLKKDSLGDLLLFPSSDGSLTSLEEYLNSKPEHQEFIYYATGSDKEQIEKLPQIRFMQEKGFSILYLTSSIDEFVLLAMANYKGIPFRNISEETPEEEEDDNVPFLEKMKELLPDEVVAVKTSVHLGDDPVCLRSRGEISIEMERTFLHQPGPEHIVAQKVLEINKNHKIYNLLENAKEEDLKKLTDLLYNQARLIEGLPIADPVEHTRNIMNLLLEK